MYSSKTTGLVAEVDFSSLLAPAISRLVRTPADVSNVLEEVPDAILAPLLRHVESRPALFPKPVARAIAARLKAV